MLINSLAGRLFASAATVGALLFMAGSHTLSPTGTSGRTTPSTGASQALSYPASEIAPGFLARRLATRVPRLLIVDIRSSAEYAVSHIPGALSVDIARPVEAVLAELAPLARDKTVVIACALGVRSAIAAELLKLRLEDLGALDVMSLQGGVIGWANDGRWLRDTNNRLTSSIHPGQESLALTVRRASLLRMTPQKSEP